MTSSFAVDFLFMKASILTAAILSAVLALPACGSDQPAARPAETEATPAGGEPADDALVGVLTREKVEEAHPDWVQAEVEAAPDAAAVRGLAAVEPGAEVIVFLGTWCSDSRREVPRLWRALDEAGGTVPFQIRYVGVDRQKKEPVAPITNYDIRFVPTFVVERGGQEVGRIVEESPHGVEQDLLALLSGKARGVISASQTEAAAPPR